MKKISKHRRIGHFFNSKRHRWNSSLSTKKDPVHAGILNLIYADTLTDMPNPNRRGLANDIHFLFIRDVYNVTAVIVQHFELQYQHHKIENRHRAIIKLCPQPDTIAEDLAWLMGQWVKDESQALDSLRQVVEHTIFTCI